MKLTSLVSSAAFTLVLAVVSVRLGWIVWNSAIEAPDRFAIIVLLIAFMVNELSELLEKRTDYYRQRIEVERKKGIS